MRRKAGMMKRENKTTRIGLIGLGTIGGGLAKLIHRKRSVILKNQKVDLKLKTVCEIDKAKLRGLPLNGVRVTRDAMSLIRDPEIDQVVELIGGLKPAGSFIKAALNHGKDVVSANKALFAQKGKPLYEASMRSGGIIGMEAAVCGGVPVIRGLKNGLVGNQIEYFYGILNGTCNYILTEMSRTGKSYAEALRGAQERGYAEKDPTLDVNGADTAHKLAILARLSFNREVDFESIYREGIEKITPEDIEDAKERGYAIKLIAYARKHKGGCLELRVHPALLGKNHLLANVNGVNNAVLIRGDEVGEVSFYGRGAGERPTAAAVLSDIVDLAVKRKAGIRSSEDLYPKARLMPMDATESRYTMRFMVADRPGVMGALTGVLGRCGVSLSSVRQTENERSPVPVVVMTHRAREGSVRKAVKEIMRRKIVKKRPNVLRVESA